jgi:hypothetical protein
MNTSKPANENSQDKVVITCRRILRQGVFEGLNRDSLFAEGCGNWRYLGGGYGNVGKRPERRPRGLAWLGGNAARLQKMPAGKR